MLRTLEECFGPSLAEGAAPELVVLWKRADLREERTSRFAAQHLIAPQAVPPGPTTLLVRAHSVFRRGRLARLLGTGTVSPSFAIVPAGQPAMDWNALQAVLGDSRDDESAWSLSSSDDVRRVERLLLRATGKPTDGLVARTLNRPISQSLSRLLMHTQITPNQISFVVLGVLAAGTWMVARGTPQGFVFGVLLFHLASVLDGCDGEIARLKFLESRRGAWLDTSVDLLGNFLLPLAIALGLSRRPGLAPDVRTGYLLEGMLTSLGIAIGVFGVARSRPQGRADFNDFGSNAVARFGVPPWLASLLRGVVHLLRRDSYVFIFVFLAVFRLPEWILHFLAAGVAVHLPVIAWSWWTSTRVAAALKAPDRP